MYFVHIKITLHIQVLVYCKKCSYPIDYGPTQNKKTIDDDLFSYILNKILQHIKIWNEFKFKLVVYGYL